MCGRTDEATVDGKTFKYSKNDGEAVTNDDDFKTMNCDDIWRHRQLLFITII